MKKASSQLVLGLCLALLAGCSDSFSMGTSQLDIPSGSVDRAPTDDEWGDTFGTLPAGIPLLTASPQQLAMEQTNSVSLSTADSETWTSTNSMALPRAGHTATLLSNG
jgi:hypothetical protein